MYQSAERHSSHVAKMPHAHTTPLPSWRDVKHEAHQDPTAQEESSRAQQGRWCLIEMNISIRLIKYIKLLSLKGFIIQPYQADVTHPAPC